MRTQWTGISILYHETNGSLISAVLNCIQIISLKMQNFRTLPIETLSNTTFLLLSPRAPLVPLDWVAVDCLYFGCTYCVSRSDWIYGSLVRSIESCNASDAPNANADSYCASRAAGTFASPTVPVSTRSSLRPMASAKMPRPRRCTRAWTPRNTRSKIPPTPPLERSTPV